MNQPIKIIFVDDSPRYRQSTIVAMKEFDFDISSILEATNGKELLLHLEKMLPDIILLDLEMPEMDGNETMEILRKSYPSIKIIVLSTHADQYLMEDYMLRGAKGYVSKDEVSGNIETLVKAINRVSEGGLFRSNNPVKRSKKITARQVEIINLTSEGKSKQEAADKLNLTRDAVYKQETQIELKLGVKKGTLADAIKALGLNFLGKRSNGGRSEK